MSFSLIAQLHKKAAFAASGRTYGSRRLCAALQLKGVLIGRHRVRCADARRAGVGSMSRKGNCWENAVVERFFLNLKAERVWQKDYANHAEATQDVAHCIVNFYNAQRLHSTLGNLSPIAFEHQSAIKKPIEVSKCPKRLDHHKQRWLVFYVAAGDKSGWIRCLSCVFLRSISSGESAKRAAMS